MDISTITNTVLMVEGVIVVGSVIHHEVNMRRLDKYISACDQEREFNQASKLLAAPDHLVRRTGVNAPTE